MPSPTKRQAERAVANSVATSLIWNALTAFCALPHSGNGITLWFADYPDGEAAFRAWVAVNAHHFELCDDEPSSVSVRIVRRSDCQHFATFRRDIPSHMAHPQAPVHLRYGARTESA